MKRLVLATIGLLALGASAADAADISRIMAPNAPIATSVKVPAGYETVYVSGLTPAVADPKAPAGSTATYGDTKTQAASIFGKLSDALKAQGMSLADVVMMRVYLVGDPANDGKMDFKGMMAAYTQFFGTADQPNRPSRVTVQVASLAGAGMLCEIEVQAAHAPAVAAKTKHHK